MQTLESTKSGVST